MQIRKFHVIILGDQKSLYIFVNKCANNFVSTFSKAQRKSSAEALEKIHAETQRLIRESNVSLPYFLPKPTSISEFLQKRKPIPAIPLRAKGESLNSYMWVDDWFIYYYCVNIWTFVWLGITALQMKTLPKYMLQSQTLIKSSFTRKLPPLFVTTVKSLK